MSFTLVQANQQSSTGFAVPALAIPFVSSNASKNYLSLCLRLPFGSGNTFLVTDSQNNLWQLATSFSNGTDLLQIWFVSQCAAGPNTITITEQGGGNFFGRAVIGELSGFTHAATLDQTAVNVTGTLPDISSGFIKPVRATELLIGMFANSNLDSVSPASSSDWTLIDSADGNLAAFFKAIPATPPASWAASFTVANSQQYCAAITALSSTSEGSGLPELVRQFPSATAASGTTLLAPVTLTVGNVAIITTLWADNINTVSSITDPLGNIWTPVPNTLQQNATLFGSGGSLQHWTATIKKGGSTNLTITWSGATTSLTFAGAEFSDVDKVTPVQISAGQTGNAVPASPSISPTGNVVLYANILTGDGLEKTPAAPWLILSNGQGPDDYWGPMYQIIAKNHYNFVGTMSAYVNVGAAIASFMNA